MLARIGAQAGNMLDAVPMLAGLLVFALGAMTDLVSFRIPNWISLASVALFFAAALIGGMGWAEMGWHVLVGFGALVAGMVFFAAGMIGGGDAKFFAAGALWMGPAYILKYCFVFALIGGGVAALLIVARSPRVAMALNHLPYSAKLLNSKSGLPYGVALGLGAMIVLPMTPMFLQSLPT
jgi:prepilin peptidase CpaA